MVNSSERIYSTRRASQVCFSQSPMAGHCWPVPPEKTLKHSKAGLTQCFVGSPGPGEPKVLFEPSKHLWWVWGLILNAISPLLPSSWRGGGIFFWWDPTFSYKWLFSWELQFWSSCRRRFAHVLLLCHLVEDVLYRWSIQKLDWLYSLQPKMEKLYIVSKNKTRSWLWLTLLPNSDLNQRK